MKRIDHATGYFHPYGPTDPPEADNADCATCGAEIGATPAYRNGFIGTDGKPYCDECELGGDYDPR